MKINKFSARGFRNIKSCEIDFCDGVNIFHGENAQGKTNAVEGIYMFARGKFFRAARENEVCRFGDEGFFIEIEYEEGKNKNKISYSSFGKEKKIIKNGYKIDKIYEMIGSFRAILFSPDDLTLVKNSPEERRAFLNVAISQLYPVYIKYYSAYKKALENRNCILRLAKSGLYTDENELYSWSVSLAEYASYIYVMRKKYIERISDLAGEEMNIISGGEENLRLSYKSDIKNESDDREKIKEEYIRILTSETEREKMAGVSLFGIHHDDMEIDINGRSARIYASQGQTRSAVLALKIAEGNIIKEEYGEYPVYLFDDVLSELDEKRKKYVLSKKEDKQIIITTCETLDHIDFADKVIEVKEGEYVCSHR